MLTRITRTNTANLNGSAELQRAERAGLKLAVLCRTLAIGVFAAWWIAAGVMSGTPIAPSAYTILTGLTLLGLITYAVVGTRYDRWWLKYAVYSADILAICAVFALVPLRSGSDIPQIYAFKAWGVHVFFPIIAMACLSLSWRLVLWCGAVGVAGWASAFAFAIQDMPRRLEWADIPVDAGANDYATLFLSPDFIGTGNRIVESGMLLTTAGILALAVYRARRVFFAQLAAEEARAGEQAAREHATGVLGKYVPEAVALKLVNDAEALVPHEVEGVVLVADIAGFSDFAAGKPPTDVIARLNTFLDRAATSVSRHNGVVILFTGDGLLATFNTPIPMEHPEQAALACAHDLIAQARRENFALRVGLASGPLAAGSVGSSERQAFTVYGETVNRAARLESQGKVLGASIVADRAVAKAARSEELSYAGEHALRGLSGTWPLWTLPFEAAAGGHPDGPK